MRNAALTLGIIAGVFGMLVGLVGFGWTEVHAGRTGRGTGFRRRHQSGADPGDVR